MSRVEGIRVVDKMIALRVGAGINIPRQRMGADAAAARRDDITGTHRYVLASFQMYVVGRGLD